MSAALEVYNEFAKREGKPLLSLEEANKLRELPIKEILKSLDIHILRLPFFLIEAKLKISKHIPYMKPVRGIDQVLQQLQNIKYPMGIITSNSTENVQTFIAKNNLKVFDFITSENHIFGKDRSIKKYLKNSKKLPDDVIYIGDEVRDIEAAHKAEVKIIAVTWGFNGKNILQKNNPDYLIDKPDQLLSLLETI